MRRQHHAGIELAQSGTGPRAPRPFVPRLAAKLNYRLHVLLVPRRPLRAFARFLEAHPRSYGWFTSSEKMVKQRAFGCQMCGQCALPTTGYTCPQTCPKQLRNGPCGGVGIDGACEVYPELRCVWVVAYERAERSGHTTDLARLHAPLDHRLVGTSSWVNYWHGRDEHLSADSDQLTQSQLPWPAAWKAG